MRRDGRFHTMNEMETPSVVTEAPQLDPCGSARGGRNTWYMDMPKMPAPACPAQLWSTKSTVRRPGTARGTKLNRRGYHARPRNLGSSSASSSSNCACSAASTSSSSSSRTASSGSSSVSRASLDGFTPGTSSSRRNQSARCWSRGSSCSQLSRWCSAAHRYMSAFQWCARSHAPNSVQLACTPEWGGRRGRGWLGGGTARCV